MSDRTATQTTLIAATLAELGWNLVSRVNGDVALVAARQDPEAPKQRSVTCTVTREQTGRSGLAEWQRMADALMFRTLPRYRLIDLRRWTGEHFDLFRVATFIAGRNDSVTIEQWVSLREEEGVTISFAGSSPTYPAWGQWSAEASGRVIRDV